jgi:eukaryotic translation initiation factor 2C
MIKISAVKPPDRCAQIIKWRQELAYEQQDKIRAWGLQVSYLLFDPQQRADGQIKKQLMKVPARILPAPSVMYARNQDARPTDGSWNLRGKEVSWIFILCVESQADISSSETAKPPSKPGL